MAMALDNYPAEDADPYDSINIFPDEIMRKDILDELQPPGHSVVPKEPLPPRCHKCAELQVQIDRCILLQH